MHWNGYWACRSRRDRGHGSLKRCHAVAQCAVGSGSSDVSVMPGQKTEDSALAIMCDVP